MVRVLAASLVRSSPSTLPIPDQFLNAIRTGPACRRRHQTILRRPCRPAQTGMGLLVGAAELVVACELGSAAMLQRPRRVGEEGGRRLMVELEAIGVVGPVGGTKPGEVKVGIGRLRRFMNCRGRADHYRRCEPTGAAGR